MCFCLPFDGARANTTMGVHAREGERVGELEVAVKVDASGRMSGEAFWGVVQFMADDVRAMLDDENEGCGVTNAGRLRSRA